MQRFKLLPLVVSFLFVSVHSPSITQEEETQAPDTPVSEQGGVSPGFSMDALIKQVSGPVGGTAEFQFTITSLGGTKRVRVRPVELSQERNGRITMVSDEERPEEVSMDVPDELDVSDTDETTIGGTVQISQEGGAKRFYGLLISDLGRPVERQQPAGEEGNDDGGRTVRINYITRYLLRVELTVAGAPEPNFSSLAIEETGLQERDGHAYAYAILNNQTNSTVNIRARARLRQKQGRPLGPPFFLHLPVSASKPVPERYDSKILSGTTVVLRRRVPEPVLPGSYTLTLNLRRNARTIREESVEVRVEKGQFPAQKSVVSRVVRKVQVEPPYASFSRRAGGDRVQSIRFKNTSNQPVSIRLKARPRKQRVSKGDEEKAVSWLTYRPDTFTIKEGGQQDVFMSSSSANRENTKHRYAFLEVTVEPTETIAGGKMKMPVAFLARKAIDLQYDVGKLQTGRSGNDPVLLLPVRNRGDVHLELSAKLRIENPFGGISEIKGGFGRWIMPGKKKMVQFRLEKVPPRGDYSVQVELDPGHGKSSKTFDREFSVP